MGIAKTENEETQRPIQSPGQTLGKCFQVIDLGTQTGAYQGKPIIQRKIWISWETPKFRAEFSKEKGEQVMVISNEYTNSLDPKAGLRQMLDSWFAKPIDKMPVERAKKLLGMSAMLQIINEPKKKNPAITQAKIASKGKAVFPVDPSLKPDKKTENEQIYFDLDPAEYSDEVFAKVPEFLRKKIMDSPEYKALKAGAPAATGNAIVDAQGADFNQEEEDF